MADNPTSDDLRDALQGLAGRLDGLIDALPPGDATRAGLEAAQNTLTNAAADVDAASIEAILTNNADLQKIKDVTAKVNASAAAIAASVANVTKIANIATAALALATSFGGGAVATILGAAQNLYTALG